MPNANMKDKNRAVNVARLDVGTHGGVYEACRLTATAFPTGSYSSTTKTFTVTATGATSIDSVAPAIGDRVLITGDTTNNGIFRCTGAGAGSTSPTFIRASDMLNSADFKNGATVAITAGTVYTGSIWTFTIPASFVLDTNSPVVTVGTASTINAGNVATALGELALISTTATIANAALKTLNATPVTVVSAPAAGKYIEVVSCLARMIYATAAFDSVGATEYLELRYTDATGQIITQNVSPAGFADQSSTQQRLLPLATGAAALVNPVAAAVVVAHIATGEWYSAAGGGSLKLQILYRVRTLAI